MVALLPAIPVLAAPVTVFAPSVPSIETKVAPQIPKNGEKKRSAWKNDNIPEVDILMSLMNPHEYEGVDMDMPQLFAMLYFPQAKTGEEIKSERRDLLADVEEIRYLGKKAWGANVAVPDPGLYQFIFEGRPVWDEANDKFMQHQAKLLLPVLGVENGWDQPVVQDMEIQSLTRPFGLAAPALYSGRVVANGKPVAGIHVFAGRMNTTKTAAPTVWHTTMEAVTNNAGDFSFVFNKPGWWYCEAKMPGDPLKGPDGQLKPVEKSAIVWLYIDSVTDNKNQK